MAPHLSTSIRRAAAESTLEFDWLLGDRQMWTFKAIETLTGMSDSFLEKLWEDDQHPMHLRGHTYGAGALGAKKAKRVPRAFVVRLLVASANYSAEEKRSCVLSLAPQFNAADCRAIAEHFMAHAALKEKRR